ncbi:MAG: peptidase MA family metallohydrolase [Dehalococcoidia bacterium]
MRSFPGRKSIAVALIAAVLVAMTFGPATAQSSIRLVGEPVEENQFPEGITFSLEAESSARITEVRLRYTFLPENRSSTASATFDPGTRIRATYQLRSGTSGLYLPPGKQIRYSWEIRDADGNELIVPAKETSFADTRFPWQAVTDGNITVNYYIDDQRDAEVMALVARETIDKASALMGTTLNFPVQIWAYASQRDFQIAVAHESVTSNPGILGQAHEPDIFIMVVDRLSSPSALDTARHELTHLVTARAVSEGPYQSLYPSWLNEGTSVYLQVSPNDVGYVDALDQAIRDDKVIPLKSLTAGTRSRNVGLFYGEGYSVVKYLVDTYGQEQFAAMIDAYNRTGVLDDAFTEAFHANVDEVYRDWRVSVGLPAVAAVADQPAAAPAAAAAESSSDNTVLLAVVGTALLFMLLGVAIAAGVLLARRARSA